MADLDLKKLRRDPVAFIEACNYRRPDTDKVAPMVLSDRQRRALEALGKTDNEGFPVYDTICLIWPKRAGKSVLAGAMSVFKALHPGRVSIHLANSRQQAQANTFDMAKSIVEMTPWLDEAADVQAEQIVFPAFDSAVRVLPCNRRTVAGVAVTGLLVWDEGWAAQDGGAAYFLLSGQAETRRSQVMVVSQASGLTSHIYSLYQAAQDGTDPSLWVDYVEPEELRERGIEAHPNPYLDQNHLEAQERRLPRHEYEHYWLNVFSEGGESLFDPDDIQRAIEWSLPRSPVYKKWMADARLGAGLDRNLPQARGDSAVWTVTARKSIDHKDHYYVIASRQLETGAEDEVLGTLDDLQQDFGDIKTVHLEVYQCGDLEGKIQNAKLISPTAQYQQRMFNELARAISDGRLHIDPTMPEADELENELYRFEVDTSSALPKFSGKNSGGGDDRVYALAHSIMASRAGPTTGSPPVISGEPYVARY